MHFDFFYLKTHSYKVPMIQYQTSLVFTDILCSNHTLFIFSQSVSVWMLLLKYDDKSSCITNVSPGYIQLSKLVHACMLVQGK